MLKKIIRFFITSLLVLNLSLTNAVAAEPWNLYNPIAVGASVLYDALKGSIPSSILMTPNASQVAKVLGSGVAFAALAMAVDQLLGAVDWVLDPANNQIKYKEKPSTNPTNPTDLQMVYCDFLSVGNPTCVSANTESNAIMIAKKYGWIDQGYVYCPEENMNDSYYQFRQNSCTWRNQGVAIRLIYVENPFYNPQIQEKTLSLETIAQQVIENAEDDNVDAQVAILAAAAAIVAAAENDNTLGQPIADQLEQNSQKCPDGSKRNGKGQCWICPAEEKKSIESNKDMAKDKARSLGGCKKALNKIFDKDWFLVRAAAWDALADARDIENNCWFPADPDHVLQAQENRNAAATCRTGAAQATQ